jgi:AcrR family transcriptional regulator
MAAAPPSPPGDDPRKARREENRARILTAARDILVERTTADALPLREVARRAGYTPGALYRYFDGRDDLVRSLYMGALQLLGSYLQRAGGDTAADRLRALAHAYLLFGREQPQYLTLLFESAVPSSSWEVYLTVAWPFTLIVETVQAGIEAGELRPAPGLDTPGTAYAFWALVHGFATLQAGHLAGVAGEFEAMHAAAIDGLVAVLASSGRSPS